MARKKNPSPLKHQSLNEGVAWTIFNVEALRPWRKKADLCSLQVPWCRQKSFLHWWGECKFFWCNKNPHPQSHGSLQMYSHPPLKCRWPRHRLAMVCTDQKSQLQLSRETTSRHLHTMLELQLSVSLEILVHFTEQICLFAFRLRTPRHEIRSCLGRGRDLRPGTGRDDKYTTPWRDWFSASGGLNTWTKRVFLILPEWRNLTWGSQHDISLLWATSYGR